MADLSILGEIRLKLQGQGGTDATKQLDSTDAAARRAAKGLGATDTAARTLGRTFTTFLGGAAVASLVRSSLTEFAQFERGLNSIGFVMNRLGIDAAKALPLVREELEGIARAGGPLVSETIPAFQKLLGITKDVPAALEAVKLAADISESGLADTGAAASALAAILQGRAKEAATTLGIELRKTNGELKTNAELLEEVKRQFGGLGAEIDDTQNTLDRINNDWREFKLRVGEGVSALLGLIGGLSGITKAFQSIGPSLLLFGTAIGGMFDSIGRAATAAFNPANWVSGDFAGVVAAQFRKGFDAAAVAAEGALEELERIWKDTAAQGGEAAAKARAEAFERLTQQANRAQAEDEAKAAAKAAAEIAKKEREAAEKLAEDRAAFQAEASDELLRQQIAQHEEGSFTRLQLEIQMLQRVRDAALAEAERLGADKLALTEAFLLAEEGLRDEFEQNQTAKRKEEDERRLADKRRFEERALQLRRERAEGEKALTLAEIEAERQKNELIVGAAFMAAQAVFGQSKALAVAEIVVRTAMGVMAALASLPPNIPLAAFIAAQGALNLARVRSTTLGSGGSNPFSASGGSAGNTRATAGGGSSSQPSGGDFDGRTPPGQRVPGATTNQTIIVNGLYGGRFGLQQLARELKKAEERDKSRAVR